MKINHKIYLLSTLTLHWITLVGIKWPFTSVNALMCMYVCMCVCVCMYAFELLYVSMCLCCMCAVCERVCVYVGECVCIYNVCLSTCVRLCVRVHVCVCVSVSVSVYMYVWSCWCEFADVCRFPLCINHTYATHMCSWSWESLPLQFCCILCAPSAILGKSVVDCQTTDLNVNVHGVRF